MERKMLFSAVSFLFLVILVPGSIKAQTLFEDVTSAYGLNDSGSISNLFWYDYDNDEDQDLLCPHRYSADTYIFRNDGDHFSRLTGIGLPEDMDGGGEGDQGSLGRRKRPKLTWPTPWPKQRSGSRSDG
jgi:hypothetical protein